MHILSYWIIAALYIVKGKLAQNARVEISPNPAYIKENGSVTFKCTSTEPFTMVLFQTVHDGYYAVDFSNSCTATGALTGKERYSYNCSGSQTLFVKVARLTRKDHSLQWQCTHLSSGSLSSSKTYINVSVENVTLSTSLTEYDSKGVGKVTENSSIEINCTSSHAYPNVTVSLTGYDEYRESYQEYFSSNIFFEENSNRYFNTLVTYNVTVNRATKSWVFFCSATNKPQVEVKSRNLSVEVWYPPIGAPVILEASSVFLIIEENIGHLTCAIGDSNPPTQLNWACSPALQTNVTNTISNQANLTWTARRYTNTTCACFSRYETASSDKVSLKLITLFAATIKNLKLNGTIADVDNQKVRMIENSSVNIEWITEGNPQPVVEWTELSRNGSSIESVDRNKTVYNVWIVHRSRNGTLLNFQAKNNMKDSSGRNESNNVEKNLTLIVLYQPSVKDLKNVTVIEGNKVTVPCEITSGNVDVIFFKWSSQTKNGTTFNLQAVRRSETGWFICEVSYNMTSSFGDFEKGSIVKKLYLDVLYPPEGITVNSTLEPNHQLHDKIKIIHNGVVKLFCYASGNPVPQEYEWSGLNSSKSNVIVLKGNKDKSGNITCHAYNNMTEQPANNTIRGTGNRTIVVDILYPPQVIDFSVVNATEGTDFSLNCMSDFGRITSLEVCWHKGNKTVTCNRPLLVINVTNEDAGLYHCTVHFSMIPTFGEEVSMSIETEIMLQVNAKGVDEPVVREAPSTAAAVGGTLAGIVVVALVAVVLVYFIRKRKHPPKSTEEKILYQNASSAQSSGTASKLVTANIYDDLKPSISKVSDHEYQGLTAFPGHRAEDSETTSKLVTANIYDDLKPSIPKVSDHEYQELTSFPGCREERQKKVYENLQLLNRSEKDTEKRGATSVEQGSD